jgi:hypothetical protein
MLTEGGRLSTVDLIVLTSLDQLLFILKLYFSIFAKKTYLNEEVNRTEPSNLVRVPCFQLSSAFAAAVQQARVSFRARAGAGNIVSFVTDVKSREPYQKWKTQYG